MITSRTARLLRRTSLLALCAAQPVLAQVTVEDDSSSALRTSESGDITIADDAVLEVDGATPLFIDSDNAILIEEDGEVIADDADGRIGVHIAAGSDGSLTNEGVIQVIEDFVPEDEDANGSPDGAIASASDRTGILVESQTGSIANSGTVYVEGLESYGVRFADGWSGSFENSGTISVVGDNSIGILTGDIDGDFTVGGTVATVGAGSQVLVVDGDVDGALTIDGALTKARSYTDDDGSTQTLSRSQLRVASAAVEISGNVAGGILVDAPPLDLDDDNDDEDGDGIADDEEGSGAILSYGESPAMLIGSSEDIVIGGGESRNGTYSLAIDGSVQAYGSYSTFDALGVVIGGEGGTVTLSDGISVGGTLRATTPDAAATALLVNEGVYAPALYNSGAISAVITSTGEGSAVAVRDLSGTLSLVENTGYITVTGASEDETVALDLSHNSSGVTILQYLNEVDADAYAEELEDEDYDPSSPTLYASIVGDIVTGSGDDLIDASTGRIKGATYFGAGDDTLLLSGTAEYVGKVYSQGGALALTLSDSANFSGLIDAAGGQADLLIQDSAVFSGYSANADQLSVTVEGGLLEAAEGETFAIDELTVGEAGAIGVVVDSDDATSSTFVVNSVSFASGAGVQVAIDDVLGAEGTYTVLTADSMTGADGLTLQTDVLPLIYTADLDVSDTAIAVTIDRRTAADLGLTAVQSAAYDAILTAAENDDYLAQSILQSAAVADLQGQFDALLPDYDGGVFDFVIRSSALASRRITERIGYFKEWPTGVWLEPIYFRGSSDGADTAGFSNNGWGLSGGWEKRLGNVYAGLSGSWVSGSTSTGDYQSTDITKYEAGLHVRLQQGDFNAFARAGYYWASADFTGTFTGEIDDTEFTYGSTADWSGHGYTGTLGMSYGVDLDPAFTLRPKVVLDYYRLDEDGYQTTADSDAIALTVEDRSSDRLAVTPSLTASFRLTNEPEDEEPLTVELEGGYRSILGGSRGAVTASFDDGESFVLNPSALDGGWTVEARIRAGAWDHVWQVGIGAEQTEGSVDLSARASLNVAF